MVEQSKQAANQPTNAFVVFVVFPLVIHRRVFVVTSFHWLSFAVRYINIVTVIMLPFIIVYVHVFQPINPSEVFNDWFILGF